MSLSSEREKQRRFYRLLKDDGLLADTIKAAMTKHEARDAARRKSWASIERKKFAPLALGDTLSGWVAYEAQKLHPRRKNWANPKSVYHSMTGAKYFLPEGHADLSSKGWAVVTEYDYPYGGRWKKYSTASYRPTVSAYAIACRSRLFAVVMGKRYSLNPPKGYRFGQDRLGVFIAKNGLSTAKYQLHLDTDLVTAKHYKAAMAKACTDHIARRKANEKQSREAQKKHKARLELIKGVKIYVTDKDSTASGNCRSGTLAWGYQHGFKPNTRYCAKVIKRLSNTNTLVDRVIKQATNRTIMELELGICMLDGSTPKTEANQ